jgi:hypothetical protein
VRRRVGRVPGYQVAVFLHACLIIAGDVVEETACPITFALRHAIEVTHGLLDVLLSLLLLADIRRGDRHGAVGRAEIRIPLHRFHETPPRILVAAVRQGLHPHRVVMNHVERGGRKRFHCEALSGV